MFGVYILSMSVKHSLLALLSTGPMYGQQLKDEFEQRTGDLWPLNVGQVYTSLNRLERDGLVEPVGIDDDDDHRRPYAITAGGQIELDLWLKSSEPSTVPPRDDIVMKIMIAASIDPDSCVDTVQSHRRQLLETMRGYASLKVDPEVSTATLMMCDAELFRLEAAVRWLDSVDARIRSGARIHPARPSAATPLPSSAQFTPSTTDRTEIQS